MHPNASLRTPVSQRGASMVEFIYAAPILVMLGLATLQIGLIYQGKTVLNYSTFEAARAGAVNHAQLGAMQEELGFRLAPLQGGDGSTEAATRAVLQSRAAVLDTTTTRIEILNPTREAFENWGVDRVDINQRVIPNSHLRQRVHADPEGDVPLTLRDANLLKIKVTYGMDLDVPFVNAILLEALEMMNPENAYYYRRGKMPLTSVATVRMQSEAWEASLHAAEAVLAENEAIIDAPPSTGVVPEDATSEAVADGEGCFGQSGLDLADGLLSTSSVADGSCSAVDTGYSTPGIFEDASPVAGPSSDIEPHDCEVATAG